MRTEKCPARTKPHAGVVGKGPAKTHWEIRVAGRWRRLYRDKAHFVRVGRARAEVTIVVRPEYADAPCLAS